MSVSSLLKNYRKRNGITQDELAERFGVAKMTISRIESGRQVTLSPKMVSLIAGIVDKDDLATLDPSDPQERKLLDFTKYESRPAMRYLTQSNAWVADIRGQVDALVGQIGYSYKEEYKSDITKNTWKYQNQSNKKTWIIQILSADCSISVNDIQRYLVSRIGSAFLLDDDPIENKVSIAIPNSYDEIRSRLNFHFSEDLPFDVSILHFGDDGIIQQETYLRFNTDGGGIFDLDVDDTAVSTQAGKDHVAWARAVGNIVMREKNR